MSKTTQELMAEYRANVTDRETAHQQAATAAMRAVGDALAHISDMNFGQAKDVLTQLVEDGLPNDHGGPVTHYPLFDRYLDKALERRGARA